MSANYPPDIAARIGVSAPSVNGDVYAFVISKDDGAYGAVCGFWFAKWGLGPRKIGPAGWSVLYGSFQAGIIPGRPFDPTGPIASAISTLDGSPLVVARDWNAAQPHSTISAAVWQSWPPPAIGASFHYTPGPQVGTTPVNVGNSVSIASVPAIENPYASGARVGETVYFPGVDGSMWQESFICPMGGPGICAGLQQLSPASSDGNNGIGLDFIGDSVAASWDPRGPGIGLGYSATQSQSQSDVLRSQGYPYLGCCPGWAGFNPGTGGWPAGARFRGEETLVRDSRRSEDRVYGLCSDALENNWYVCKVTRPFTSTTFNWAFLPWPP